MSPSDKPLVLVTGGSGFIGSWVIHQLLKDGYHVRATVRPSKIETIKATFPDTGNRLEIVVIDDIANGDYTSALKGVGALIHVGSPTPVAGNTAKAIYEGATKGLENIIGAAIKAGVKKIIFTSSVASLYAPDMTIMFQPKVLSESDWGNLPPDFDIEKLDNPGMAYQVSKLACELEFWKYADQNPDVDFSAILPTMAYGGWLPNYPLTNPEVSSNQIIYQLITGEPGEGPNSFPKWPFPQHVHVADIAKAHVRALETPPLKDSRRKRFIISQGSFTFLEAIKLVKRERPELGSRLPSEGDPVAGMQSPTMFDATFAEEVLGMKKSDYIDSEKIWLETIDQLVKWERSSKKED